MGEVIFIVPENIKQVYNLESIKKLEPILNELESKKAKNPFSVLLKYKNILSDEEISQDELHLQEDQ